MPSASVWPALRAWWLRHEKGANTPNWDLALSCEVEGRPGLILVEAKANLPELSHAGKRVESHASAASVENHDQIAAAIEEARVGLNPRYPGISINRDSHYQISNRIAFAWKLASLGIPTVLVYLGFTGDVGIRDVGHPFEDASEWRAAFDAHLQHVCPTPLTEHQVDVGPASFWLLVRSRPILAISQPVI
jgi:hypothetical protein